MCDIQRGKSVNNLEYSLIECKMSIDFHYAWSADNRVSEEIKRKAILYSSGLLLTIKVTLRVWQAVDKHFWLVNFFSIFLWSIYRKSNEIKHNMSSIQWGNSATKKNFRVYLLWEKLARIPTLRVWHCAKYTSFTIPQS